MAIRVLHIVTYMGRGGLETMLMNYYRNIDRDKVQFDFLVHRDFEADYDPEILALGGRIYHVSRLVPWSGAYRRELKAFFRGHPEYQVVHVHQDCLSSVALQCAKECGIPVRIAHSHITSQDMNLKYPIKMFYKHRIPAYATELMACGEDAGKWMFGGADFHVLPNAIDAAAYAYNPEKRAEVRAAFSVAENELLVGHVGRFSHQKNHFFLLEIFAAVQKLTAAKLLLVGDGELRHDIEKKIQELGLTDKVILTGVRSDVAELLQGMDVFAFPSNYEGLGIVAIEAQAAGLPCLISDKVPIECKKTPLVKQLPLAAGAETWAKEILAAAKTERYNTTELIRQAGFDIAENAARLQVYYLKKGEKR